MRPANASKLPAVLVVHENRGLNPYIEDVARRLAVANFIAFAPDALTSLGGYPGGDEKGGALFAQLGRGKMTEDFLAAAMWLKSRPDCTGRSALSGSASAAALSISWPCGWVPVSPPGCHFMDLSPALPMRPKSRRQ